MTHSNTRDALHPNSCPQNLLRFACDPGFSAGFNLHRGLSVDWYLAGSGKRLTCGNTARLKQLLTAIGLAERNCLYAQLVFRPPRGMRGQLLVQYKQFRQRPAHTCTARYEQAVLRTPAHFSTSDSSLAGARLAKEAYALGHATRKVVVGRVRKLCCASSQQREQVESQLQKRLSLLLSATASHNQVTADQVNLQLLCVTLGARRRSCSWCLTCDSLRL